MQVKERYDRKDADHVRYLRNKVITHTCVTCNNIFTADHKRKYCSIECNPNIRKWDRSERVCETCDATYKPRTRHQRYCKQDCQPYGNGGKEPYYQTKEWKIKRAIFIQSFTKINGIDLSNKYCIQCYMKHNRLNDMYAVDHVVRRNDGGSDEFNNLQSLCKHHHQSKSAVERNQIRRGGSKV